MTAWIEIFEEEIQAIEDLYVAVFMTAWIEILINCS